MGLPFEVSNFDEFLIGNKWTKSGQGLLKGKVFGECAGPAGGYKGVQEIEEVEIIWNEIRIGICCLTRRVPLRGGRRI